MKPKRDPIRVTAHVNPDVNALPERLQVYRQGEPSPGGACQVYRISADENTPSTFHQVISFDPGPDLRKGVTNESLLAVVIDRLEDYQSGNFPCAENAEALKSLYSAMDALHARTTRRNNAGTVGKQVEVPYVKEATGTATEETTTTTTTSEVIPAAETSEVSTDPSHDHEADTKDEATATKASEPSAVVSDAVTPPPVTTRRRGS